LNSIQDHLLGCLQIKQVQFQYTEFLFPPTVIVEFTNDIGKDIGTMVNFLPTLKL
jgi:hypothetical protein